MEVKKEYEVLYYVSKDARSNRVSNGINTLVFEFTGLQKYHSFSNGIADTYNYCRVKNDRRIPAYLENVVIPIKPITKPAIVNLEDNLLYIIPIFDYNEYCRLENIATFYVSAYQSSSASRAFYEAICESEQTRSYRYCDIVGNLNSVVIPKVTDYDLTKISKPESIIEAKYGFKCLFNSDGNLKPVKDFKDICDRNMLLNNFNTFINELIASDNEKATEFVKHRIPGYSLK